MAKVCKFSGIQPNKWVKGKMIGSGSFGSIFLAMDKATGGLFVVKSAESEAGLKCLESEVNILENLDSPHVVKFIGKDFSLESNGKSKFSFFLEYVTSGSLADVSEKFGGSLDEDVIRLYTKGILQGLKYIHENGIVHCDLKGKNILLGTFGEVKLADFGCAKRIKEKNMKGVPKILSKCIAGTPLWMAPEILRNEELDFGADVWSLGCTIIEMATGKPPWAGDITNPLAAVLRIACSNEIPQFPAHFSGEGLDFLAKCLERDTKKRWKVEELLDHPFVSRKLGSNIVNKISATSPASVLEARFFTDMDFSDESCDEDDVYSGNILVTIRCNQESWKDDSNSLENDSWITVRSS